MDTAGKTIAESGGAKGSDDEWAQAAHRQGHHIWHHVVDGTKGRWFATRMLSIKHTDEAELRKAEKYMKDSVGGPNGLAKAWPRAEFSKKLLTRNYFQVESTSSLYAVGNFLPSGKARGKAKASFMNVQVEGGTGWTVQAFAMMAKDDLWTMARLDVAGPVDTIKAEHTVEGRLRIESMETGHNRVRVYLSMYFFNQSPIEPERQGWWQGTLESPQGGLREIGFFHFRWRRLTDSNGLPPPPKSGTRYTAVGTRELLPIGRSAIHQVMEKCQIDPIPVTSS